MKSIILAAGKGTRMKSELPKVLHEIMTKPLLGYVIDSVKNLCEENIVIVGYKAEEVKKYVCTNYETAKIVLQKEQLGTGHAVASALSELNGYIGEVIILCGDTPLIKDSTLKEMVKTHKNNNSDLTVMSAVVDNPTNYGRIIRNSDNSVNSIVEEKDATPEQKKINEINAGIYCFNWAKISPFLSELKANNAQNEYYLTDIVKKANENNLKTAVYVIKDDKEIYGINSRENLAQAASILQKNVNKKLMENGVTIISPETTWISTDTEIGQDTVIFPSCVIEGKNKIGKNCKIGPFAHIRGGVETEDFVKIGNFVELKKAKIKHNTNICHLTYIGDSEVGSDVNIGAGTITANYNALTKEKSKTVIENNVKIGSNSVLVAPVKIEEGANIGAGSVITKDIKPWTLAITRAPMRTLENWVKSKLGK